MNGTKGTGKTVSAKLLCNELDMPVVIVDSDFEGRILEFIQNLDYECVVLIDEAEKTFKDERDNSEILLKLIDGIYNRSRKLYILTTNRLTVNENLLGRPGRIRYIQEFNNLDPKLISQYLDDNLKDKGKKQYVTEVVDLLEISTIDILKNVVDEVNLFGEIPEDSPMNIPRGKYVFDVLKLWSCTEDDIPEVKAFLDKHKQSGKSLYEWLFSKADDEDLPESYRNDDDNYYNYELLRNDYGFVKNCTYSTMDKLSTKYSMMWKDCDTSVGRVLTEPDAFHKEGGEYSFMLIEGKYDKEVYLCVVLRQRKSPTLYHGIGVF
jgi:hypothetical protein